MRKYNREQHKSSNNFLWLLAALLVLLALPMLGSATSMLTSRWVLAVPFSILIVAGIYVVTSDERDLVIGWTLGLVSLTFSLIEPWTTSSPLQIAQTISGAVFLTFICFHLFRTIITSAEVNRNVIVGSVAGFFILGIIGGQMCRLLEWIEPGSYSFPQQPEIFDFFYYSFVTITTLGYGDVLPVTRGAKSLTIFLSVGGQLYVTVVIAILIGKYLSKGE